MSKLIQLPYNLLILGPAAYAFCPTLLKCPAAAQRTCTWKNRPIWRLVPSIPTPLGSEPPVPQGGESRYPEYEDSMPNQAEELAYFGADDVIDKYRQDLQNTNDQWQLNVFLKSQIGTWQGIWSEYIPIEALQGTQGLAFRLSNIYRGKQICLGDYNERLCSWKDYQLPMAPDGAALQPILVAEQSYIPDSFRGEKGSMAVDNAFSFSSLIQESTGQNVFTAEIWLRHGDLRQRVQFVYRSERSGEALSIEKIVTKKERLGDKELTAEEPELFGREGRGIYDRTSKMHNAIDLGLQGGLALSFVPILSPERRSSLIVDWTAGGMRYQADRKFERPDGSLASLELTQIGTADSQRYILDSDVQIDKGDEAVPSVQAPSTEI